MVDLSDVHDHIYGRYCWINRAFLINYAMDRARSETSAGSEDVLGKTDYDLPPTFLADQFRLDDELVLTGKRIVNRIELVGQPEGLTVWNVTNKIPLWCSSQRSRNWGMAIGSKLKAAGAPISSWALICAAS